MLKVISLFSGAGGLDLGFRNAGCELIWANDCWEEAAETYRQNIGSHITSDPIETIPSTAIPDGDIIIGGFPCQGFSVANIGRHTKDKRNQLYLEFVRVLVDKKPLFFLAENVKGILSLGKGLVFERILEDFSEAGYVVTHHVFNAADYGVPQKRERVFLFGIRKDFRPGRIVFPPKPTHAPRNRALLLCLKPWVGVGTALQGIPEPDQPHSLENHIATQYKLRFNGYLGHRNIDPDEPSPTITARGDENGGVVIHHHPSNRRRLTVREAAIIQSFPVDFRFTCSKTSAYRQIANAVPPLLAEEIAHSILETYRSSLSLEHKEQELLSPA